VTIAVEASRPTLAQAKAWLATVIDPMADALRVEESWLASGNPSLRAYEHDLGFDFLWDSHMTVSRRYEPNMRQLFRHYPEIGAAVAEHDDGVKSLMRACSDALEQLLGSSEFARLFAQLPHIVPNDFGTGMVEERAIAAAIVNGVKLEDHDFLARAWNPHADELLVLRSEPALRPRFEALESALAVLHKRVQTLLAMITSLQDRLAEARGLAPVDPDVGPWASPEP
jgi:hypothetical protein